MTEIRFTKKEAKVLDLLERNPGRIVTRKLLLENVWGYRGRSKDPHGGCARQQASGQVGGNAGYTNTRYRWPGLLIGVRWQAGRRQRVGGVIARHRINRGNSGFGAA